MKRHIKIIATLGPSSNTREVIRDLALAGADVFRLNMSHGTQADKAEIYGHIRDIEAELQRPICILADLQGPKLRCGAFANPEGEILQEGQAFTLDLDPTPGDANRVCVPHPEIFAALEPGAELLINDGNIRLAVQDATPDSARTIVQVGGRISNRKGVNVPSVTLPLSALTEKDRSDLEFACALGVDWIALSFVQRPEDIEMARALIGTRTKIMAKIEKPAALQSIEAILERADGIMVARGDLGVELPVQNVPPVQKRLIKLARGAGKPVVVATQMMESMITAPVPTRAEVSDVATAIYEGADAVMLSAESAAGDYPVKAVQTMHDVACEVESDPSYQQLMSATRQDGGKSDADSITAAAREIALSTDVTAIACYTQSGTTALRAARERPPVPILALTPNQTTARQLSLVWGLRCEVVPAADRFRTAVGQALQCALDAGLADAGARIIVTAGTPLNASGTTNILRIASVDEFPELQS